MNFLWNEQKKTLLSKKLRVIAHTWQWIYFFSDPQLILSRSIRSVARRWPTRCNRLHRSITYPTAASITSRNYLYSIMAAVTAEELGCESVAIFARNHGLHQSASTERSHSDPYRQRLRTNTVSPSCAVRTIVEYAQAHYSSAWHSVCYYSWSPPL